MVLSMLISHAIDTSLSSFLFVSTSTHDSMLTVLTAFLQYFDIYVYFEYSGRSILVQVYGPMNGLDVRTKSCYFRRCSVTAVIGFVHGAPLAIHRI